MEVLIAFVAGALAACLVLVVARRGRGPAASPAPAPVPQPEPAEPEPFDEPEPPELSVPGPSADLSPVERLQALAEPLSSIGDLSVHPRDVGWNPVFHEAVRIFRDHIPIELVVDYVGGYNWMLASAACAGLSERADRHEAAGDVRRFFLDLRPWPMYYALRFFESVGEQMSGRLLLRAPAWWADHPFIPAVLAEHFVNCDGVEGTSFGGALPSASQAEITAAEALLKKIDHAAARGLLDEIAAFRRTLLDRPYLQTVGRFIELEATRSLLVEHDAIREQLDQAEAAIFQRPARSLLVVGETGCGKTSFLSLFALRAQRKGWTIFEAAGPQVQAGQVYIGELEERLRRLTVELDAEKRVLWHVPDFVQLAVSGTHKGQTASILDQIMPAVSSGRLVLISEITPAALTRLLQQRPGLRTVFELVRLRELDEAEADALVREVAGRLADKGGITLESDALETATHLARHHLATGEMPGAIIDLLKLAAKRLSTRAGASLTRDDVIATVSQLTGMPRAVLDDRERVDLSALRGFFTSRVIGQTEAVEAVVDRIAMMKAGLTDPDKPVGVFLFAGPTGTGKTELAKTLAAYLFGSDERLIRLDMSEFQSADALRKIIGDPGASDGLTDHVRRQPFSVVLLDEFEKSHPNIWDLFLQVFDDGRLTDANGHTVDFRHCIIVLTSNLGSTIRQDSGPGFVAQDHALSEERVKKAIHQSFRPEFINRLDRIIIFRALTRDDMRRIVGKELAQVLERRGLRNREWAVEWEASALEFLLDKGFSPAMGARPLKRAIDEHLLAPLAATLVEHRFPEGDQFLFVRSDGRGLQVEFVDPDAPAQTAARPEPEPAAAASTLTLPRMMLHPAGSQEEWRTLAAELQSLESRLVDERWTSVVGDLASRMQRPDFWNQPDRQAILSRFEVMDRVKAALASAGGLAKRVERSADASKRYSRDLIARLASQLFIVGHGIEDALTDAPVEMVLSVQPVLERGAGAAVAAEWCERLLGMYRAWAAHRGMRVHELDGSASRPLMVISGFGAARLLTTEPGLHVMEYESRGESERVVARVAVAPTPPTIPDDPAGQRAVLSAVIDKASPSSVVRRYQMDSSPTIRDLKQGWRTGNVDLVFEGHFDLMSELSGAGTQA